MPPLNGAGPGVPTETPTLDTGFLLTYCASALTIESPRTTATAITIFFIVHFYALTGILPSGFILEMKCR
jgi:hypothetical protein